MRLKWCNTYYLKAKTTTTDGEGSVYSTYSSPVAIQANIYPASGKQQAEMYGERLSYILNMLYEGTQFIDEGDGVCVYVASSASPDYKVISIKSYHGHKLLELEKVM